MTRHSSPSQDFQTFDQVLPVSTSPSSVLSSTLGDKIVGIGIEMQAVEFGNLCNFWPASASVLPLESVRIHEAMVFTLHLDGEQRSVALTPVKEITGGSSY